MHQRYSSIDEALKPPALHAVEALEDSGKIDSAAP
jgi:hypothetical protein